MAAVSPASSRLELRGDLTAATLTGAAVIDAASAGVRVLCVLRL